MDEQFFYRLVGIVVSALVGLVGTGIISLIRMWGKQNRMDDQIETTARSVERLKETCRAMAETQRTESANIRDAANAMLQTINVHIAEDREMHKRVDEQVAALVVSQERGFLNDREHYKEADDLRQRVARLEK